MATLMLDNGADIRYIQEMLGHVKLETTQIYTQVSIRMLQQVHQATHPSAKLGRWPGPGSNPTKDDAAAGGNGDPTQDQAATGGNGKQLLLPFAGAGAFPPGPGRAERSEPAEQLLLALAAEDDRDDDDEGEQG